MVQTPSKTISLDEFLKLPETKPASEYINGQIIQKPMPQGQHSTIQGELVTAINAVTKANRVAWAFPELRCTFGGRSIVPDIAVFQWAHIPVNEDGSIANTFSAQPDWTIEILSPDHSSTRVASNILHCLDHGGDIKSGCLPVNRIPETLTEWALLLRAVSKTSYEMGWLIDPSERLVQVYDPDKRLISLESSQDTLPVPTFAEALKLTVGKLFGWLQVRF